MGRRPQDARCPQASGAARSPLQVSASGVKHVGRRPRKVPLASQARSVFEADSATCQSNHDPFVSLLEVHKLMYFMQAMPAPSRSSTRPSNGDSTGRCIRSRGSGSITRSIIAKTSRNRTADSGSCGRCGATPIGLGTAIWRGASRAGHATATSSPASAGSRIETPCSVATARRKNRHTWRRAARASVRGCTQATRPADHHIRFCTTAPSVVPALRERIIEPGRRRLAFVFRQGRMDFRSNSSRKPVTRSRMQRLGDSGKADVGSCLPRAVQEAASSAIRLLSTFSKR